MTTIEPAAPSLQTVSPSETRDKPPPPAMPDAVEAAKPAVHRKGLAPHRLQRVLMHIEARLAEPVLVAELAEQIHMSPFHFARMFKLATGYAPHAYITQQRMERAKELLAMTEMPLLEVAERVGYQTQAHFTGVFHRYIGTTPRVYRMQHRAAAPRAG